jgi:hypothetical protein
MLILNFFKKEVSMQLKQRTQIYAKVLVFVLFIVSGAVGCASIQK